MATLVGQQRWLQLALGVCCVGMLVVIGAELTAGGAPPSEATSPHPTRSAAAPLPPFRMPPLSAFSEVVARPLFSRSRRPGAATAALAGSSAFALVGTVIASGERHALLASGQPPRVSRVGEGQEIGGWTVEQILPNKVIVRHGDQREEVKARDFTHGARNPAGTGTAGVPSSPAVSRDTPPQPPRRRPGHDG